MLEFCVMFCFAMLVLDNHLDRQAKHGRRKAKPLDLRDGHPRQDGLPRLRALPGPRGDQ